MRTLSSFLGRGFGRAHTHEGLSAIILVAVGALLANAVFGAELITNGTFESPTGNGQTPTGWTKDFNSYGTYTGAARSGGYGLHPGADGNSGGEYQDITTVAGETYNVSVWVQNFDAAVGTSHLDVLVGTPGTSPFALPDDVNGVGATTTAFASDVTDHSYVVTGNWQQVTFIFTATGTTTRFGLYNSYKTGDTQHSVNVDDVSVVPITLYPQITTQPQSQAVEAGDNATFTVTATGADPLNYQWYLNDNAFTNLEASSFTLTGVTTNEAGQYYVIVTNTYGSATSTVATLTVNSWGLVTNGGFEKNTGSGTLPSGWNLIANSYGAWPAQPPARPPHSGSWVMHAGANSQSGGEYQDITTVPGQDYRLTFWAVGWVTGEASQSGKVQVGTPGSDPVDLNLNNNAEYLNQDFSVPLFAGAASWTRFDYVFTPVSAVTRLSFQNLAPSAVNIDDVSVRPFYSEPIITNNPGGLIVECGSSVTLTVTAGGAPPLSYQWYFNDSPLSGETASALALPDVSTSQAGNYFVLITNLYGATTSSVAMLNVMCSGLLTNGGFEFNSGNGIPPAGWNLIVNSYGAWSAQPPTQPPHRGGWVMHAGANAGSGGEYQDVATIRGQGYQLTFWAVGWLTGEASQSGRVQVGTPGLNDTDLAFNNNAEYVNQVFNVPRFDSAANWTQFTYTFLATSPITRVSFQNLAPSAVNIDDVSLVETTIAPPQPTASIQVSGGLATIRFDTVPGIWYRVVRTGTLEILPAVTTWAEVAPGWAQATGFSMEVRADAASPENARGFFRVEASTTMP